MHFLYSNCESKTMPLTEFSQSSMIPFLLLCLLFRSTSSVTSFVGSAVSWPSISRCSTFCSSRDCLHYSLTTACLLSSCSVEQGRPKCCNRYQAAYYFTARQIKKETKYMHVCSNNSRVHFYRSEEPMYSENSSIFTSPWVFSLPTWSTEESEAKNLAILQVGVRKERDLKDWTPQKRAITFWQRKE